MIIMMLIMAFPIFGIVLFFFLPLKTALVTYLLGTAAALFYHRAMMRSRSLPVQTGRRGMIGLTAVVISWHAGRGMVRCHGEIWQARCPEPQPLEPGRETVVTGIDHLVLIVRPLASGHKV